MTEIIQKILLANKRLKLEKFPDHICAQVNRIMCSMGSVVQNADIIKYEKHDSNDYHCLKNSLINIATQCVRMLEELEKLNN